MNVEFNKNHETVYTSEDYYDLFDGGYIEPCDLLSNQDQVDCVNDAIETIKQFLSQAADAGLIEYI